MLACETQYIGTSVTVSELNFFSPDFDRLINDLDLLGSWRWDFTTETQVWSNGLFRLLGLNRRTTKPHYGSFASLIHPEDRAALATASEIRHGVALPNARIRIIRPDGTIRTLDSRTEIRWTPDGRPRMADGVVIDITNPHALARAHLIERRHRGALFTHSGFLYTPISLDMKFDFPPEAALAFGRSLEEINADATVRIIPEDRTMFIEHAIQQHQAGSMFQVMAKVHLRRHGPQPFRILSVPVRDERGVIVGRAGLSYRSDMGSPPIVGTLRDGLEQGVRAHHLRAARAMLGWSMTTLAQASGLSLSTVKRLEENAGPQGHRSHHSAIAALRRSGIRFLAMDDSTIAIAKA